MNDENLADQTDSLKAPKTKKEQPDNKAASQPDEVKKLQESFGRVYNGPDKLRHEYDLRFEAKQLDMGIEEYRRWYELSSKPSTWRSRFWQWTGFGEKKVWDVLQLLIVPLFLLWGANSLQDNAKQREQYLADNHAKTERELANDRTRQESLNKYFDTMTDFLFERNLRTSKENAEVRTMARARTLTTLRGLDGDRKGQLLRFFIEAKLIRIIPLNQSDLSEVNLSQVNLSEANLREAKDAAKGLSVMNDMELMLNTFLSKKNPNDSRIARVNLSEANLSYADLREANLMKTYLYKANLSGADLTKADLRGAYLSKANLHNASLSYADLHYADLSGSDLSGAYLINANLSRADLSGANIEFTYLHNANLSRANLSGANLSNDDLKKTNLRNTNLSGANLSDANLSGADLREANLSKTQEAQAKLCNTTMPNGKIDDRDCEKLSKEYDEHIRAINKFEDK